MIQVKVFTRDVDDVIAVHVDRLRPNETAEAFKICIDKFIILRPKCFHPKVYVRIHDMDYGDVLPNGCVTIKG